MPATTITATITMQEVLAAHPSAQRALFKRYHIRGCSGCDYQPTDTLEEAVHSHNICDVDDLIAHIQEADAFDRRMQVQPVEVAAALGDGTPLRLVDVRTPEEWELAQKMMRWPKDTPIVFHCHHGSGSLDAAAYFAGHAYQCSVDDRRCLVARGR